MQISEFYTTMRLILGDRRVHGIWNYAEDTLAGAVQAVFLLGRNPTGYSLGGTARDAILPDPPSGDPWALICYDACLLLVGGEDGRLMYRTKAISVHDGGDRKRDLITELRMKIYEIRNGSAVFSTVQTFIQFVHNGAEKDGGIFAEFTQFDVVSGVPNIKV